MSTMQSTVVVGKIHLCSWNVQQNSVERYEPYRNEAFADQTSSEMRISVNGAADGSWRTGPGFDSGQSTIHRPSHEPVDRNAGVRPEGRRVDLPNVAAMDSDDDAAHTLVGHQDIRATTQDGNWNVRVSCDCDGFLQIGTLFDFERYRRPEIPESGSDVPAIPDRSEAIAWLATERPTLIAVGTYAAHHGWPQHVSDLSAVLGPYLLLTAHYADAALLHQQAIDTTTPAGRMFFQVMGAFAEFERGMIRSRVNAGLARARARGVKPGTAEGVAEGRDRH